MAEMERRTNSVIFKKEIVADNPNSYAGVTLEFEGLAEEKTAELRILFNSFYGAVEQLLRTDARPEMKSYKRLAEETKQKILSLQESGDMEEWECAIDSWIAFMERDRETPEEEKKAEYREMAERLEMVMGQAKPRPYLNSTFSYITLREKLEPPEAAEKRACLYHVRP